MKNELQEYLDFLEEEKYRKSQEEEELVPTEYIQQTQTQTTEAPKVTPLPNSYIQASQTTPTYSLSGKKSLSELEADPEFDKRAARFLEGIGRNENIFEFLRDSDYNLSSAIQRSFEVGKWTEEQKKDYLYLREQFDNAELSGLKERLGFVKDFAIDVVRDPLNIPALLFTIPTMGTSAAGKIAATQAANQGIKQLIKSSLKAAKKPAIYGAAEGMAWAGPHEYFLQSMDVDLGARDEIDMSVVAGTAALGGLIGGGLVGGLSAINSGRYLAKEFKYSNEEAIIKEGKKKSRKQIATEEQVASVRENLNKKSAKSFFGKATTEFVDKAKKSDTLKKLLDNFRYDWDITIFGPKDIKVRKDSYGLALGRLQGKLLTGMGQALNGLNKVRKSRFNWSGVLDAKDNDQLAYLLRGGKEKIYKGEEIGEDVLEAYEKIKVLLEDTFNKGLEVGLFNPLQKITNYMPRKFKYEAIENNYDDFVDLLVKSGHANPVNDIKQLTTINVNEVVDGVTKTKKVQGTLDGQLGVDMEAFGRDFLKEADNDIAKATRLKAEQIVDDMLEYRWTPFELRSKLKAGNGSSFLQHRAFSKIKDNDLIPFLENDVELVLQDYFTNASQSIERTRFFGRSVEDFRDNYLNKIQAELRASGVSKEDTKEVIERLTLMHGRVTGLDVPQTPKALRGLSDWGRLSQQMAHLPLATLSSITEPLILLSRVGLTETPETAAIIGKSLVAETIKTGQRIAQGVQRGLGKKTKNLKDLDDETWSEIYQTGLALEQSVMDRIESLYGEALGSSRAKELQNMFFKTNLLTQWTSAVQLAAFTTGKRLIVRNAEKLSKGGLKAKEKQFLVEQLNDLGIDADEAVNFYKKSLNKDGIYSGRLAKQQEFYDTKLLSGANRFTKEIILNPSTAEANRPLWYSTPAAQMLIQFAGYPTVFNNTVLKRFITDIKDYPGQTAPRIAGTMLLMTGVAMMGNYIRNPEYFDKNIDGTSKATGEIIMDGWQRWGGLGPLDYSKRYTEAGEAGAGPIASLAKGLGGPLPQDVIDGMIYRKGWLEIAGTNLPFYSAYDLFGEGTKKELRSKLRAIDKQISGTAKDEEEELTITPAYAKGGIVKNVPNVTDEPDEMQSRVTGMPFNSTADFMQDEEDRALKGQMSRLGLADGGFVSEILQLIAAKRKYKDTEFLKKYAEDVAWQESRGKGPQTIQENNGIARGKYQVEGSLGSNRNDTIIQRALNFYDEYPDAPITDEIKFALSQKGKDLDFSTLSEETQDALFYMDAERGTLPLDKLATGELSHELAWMNHWNQGPDVNVMQEKWRKAQKEKELYYNNY